MIHTGGTAARRHLVLASNRVNRRRSASLKHAPQPLPTPLTDSDVHPALPNPNDPVFLSRYRNPTLHDQPRIIPGYRVKRPTPAPTTSTLPPESNEQPRSSLSDSSPRGRRLEMESLWSGGDYSGIVPAHYADPRGSKKHAILFPGSGSQYVGMGAFLQEHTAAQRVWGEAEESLNGFEEWRRSLKLEDQAGEVGILGKMLEDSYGERRLETTLKKVVFEGPQDELTRSTNSQPAILITSIASLKTLEDYAPRVSATEFYAGHSSGELTALVASGAASLKDGVRLARLHGILTSHALALPSISLSATSRPGMSALIVSAGHSHAEVQVEVARMAEFGLQVEVASFNSSTQIVLAGTRDGILRASDALREKGIAVRVADLPVSAPFHCSFMAPAGEAMRVALQDINLFTPSAPLLSGTDGNPTMSPSSIISNLVASISTPVRWSTVLSTLRTSPVKRLIFVGPGKALRNLAAKDLLPFEREKEIGDRMEVMSAATLEDMQQIQSLYEQVKSV